MNMHWKVNKLSHSVEMSFGRTNCIRWSVLDIYVESGISLKPEELKKGTGLKILTLKQMLQRLPIALAQIKADNNSESSLNEIRQITSS